MKRLEEVQTYSGFMVATMGFGKTYMALLFMAYYAIVVAKRKLPSQVDFCLIFCIMLSGMVLHQ